MAKFYTGTGDDGTTGLLGEGRVPKQHPIPETVGTVDEATAALGMARAACQAEQSAEILLAVQRDLYHLMAELAATPENAPRFRQIDCGRVGWLEKQIDELEKVVEMPREFIVPGDSLSGAALALARTVVRRAERRVALLLHDGMAENVELLRYLNRLSSLCFVLELLENQAQGKRKSTLAKEK
jgi:cob(I)alamin adenosyltransferase